MNRSELNRANNMYEIMERTGIETNHLKAAVDSVALNMKVEFSVPTGSGMPVAHLVLVEKQEVVNEIIQILHDHIMEKHEQFANAFAGLYSVDQTDE